MAGLDADVRIAAPIHPTEDPEKVERAIRNLFPDARVRSDDDRLVAEADDLTRLADLVADQRIQDTARAQLLHAADGDAVTVRLSKQAAFAGAVNFSVGDVALGDLDVTIRSDRLDVLIDRVAPATATGEATRGDEDG